MTPLSDIGATTSHPLHPNHPIKTIFDGVFVHSIESFLLSLQIYNEKFQGYFCSVDPDMSFQDLSEMRDKSEGMGDFDSFFWKTEPINRNSQCFDVLIDRLLIHISGDENFIQALIDTAEYKLIINPEACKRFRHILPREDYSRRLCALRNTNKQISKPKQLFSNAV